MENYMFIYYPIGTLINIFFPFEYYKYILEHYMFIHIILFEHYTSVYYPIGTLFIDIYNLMNAEEYYYYGT